MDKRLWQTLGAVDLVRSSYKWIPAILLCGKHSTSMQIRIVSRLRFCRNSVHFRKSNICASGLDLQETNLSFTKLNRSLNHFSRCRFRHGWNSRIWSLGLGCWSISFFTKANQHNQRCKRVTEKLVANSSVKHAKTNSNHEHQSRSDQYWSRSIKRNTFWFQCFVVCLWGIMKPWLRW